MERFVMQIEFGTRSKLFGYKIGDDFPVGRLALWPPAYLGLIVVPYVP